MVSKSAYLKDMDDMDTFNISVVDIVKESMSSISFRYADFDTKLGRRYATYWWYSIFTKFNPYPVSSKPEM